MSERPNLSLPLKVKPRKKHQDFRIDDGNGFILCYITYHGYADELPPDVKAREIARACNNHDRLENDKDKLIEALEGVLVSIDKWGDFKRDVNINEIASIRRILAEAKGGE